MSTIYDVIIVGAGPAGASLAARLSKAGRHVLLVDQSTFPRPKVCGECLSTGAWQQLVALGLEPPVAHVARWPHQVRISASEVRSVALPLRAQSSESIATISREALDLMLLKHAAACGAELLLEHRLRRVLSDGAGVRGIEVTGVTSPVTPVRLGCRMLVAADGRASQVVRQTGVVSRRGPALVGFKTHLPEAAPDLPLGEVTMLGFAGGYLGLCPIADGQMNVCGLLPAQALRASRGSVADALRTRLAGHRPSVRQRLLDAGKWQTIAGVQQQVARPSQPGVLYVGDAQGTIEPLAGQGIAMALEGAALAAARLLSGKEIDCRLQQSYHAEWQQRYRGAIRRASWFGWLLRHPPALAALLALSPVPPAWKSRAARQGYIATRLKAC